MATFKIVVSSYKRSDSKFQVRIRVIHNTKPAYLKTPYTVEPSDLNKKGDIINTSLLFELKQRILGYERSLLRLGSSLDSMPLESLISHLNNPQDTENTDIIQYFQQKIDSFYSTKANQTAKGYQTALDRFTDFLNKKVVLSSELNLRLLNDFELHLRNTIGPSKKKVSNTTIKLYMTYLKALSKIACDEDILNKDPFRKYKMPDSNQVKKRNLPIETIRMILNAKTDSELEQQAIDVVSISFMLCGMNTADIYYCPPLKRGRIEYQRTKTKDRRKDKALISILIQPELRDLLSKYKDSERQFNFHRKYTNIGQFNKRVNKGLENLCERLEIEPITTYHIRHTFATIARNDLHISKDDIHLALNHSSAGNITDVYLATDWSIIDRVNRKVIDYLFESSGGMKVLRMAN